MTVFGGVSAIHAPVLVHVAVTLQVRIQHRLIDAGIRTLVAFEGFRSEMVTQVVFQMVFVFGHERAFRARQQSFRFDMASGVFPESQFGHGAEIALLTPECFHL